MQSRPRECSTEGRPDNAHCEPPLEVDEIRISSGPFPLAEDVVRFDGEEDYEENRPCISQDSGDPGRPRLCAAFEDSRGGGDARDGREVCEGAFVQDGPVLCPLCRLSKEGLSDEVNGVHDRKEENDRGKERCLRSNGDLENRDGGNSPADDDPVAVKLKSNSHSNKIR